MEILTVFEVVLSLVIYELLWAMVMDGAGQHFEDIILRDREFFIDAGIKILFKIPTFLILWNLVRTNLTNQDQ